MEIGWDGTVWDGKDCIPRPQQFSMSLTPHQSLSPAPLFAGLHAFANTLKNGVLPSAVLASATLLM